MNPQKKLEYVQRIFNPGQNRSLNGLANFNKDNFLRVMNESISKALSPNETPVKEKHVRRLLIGSHQASNGLFFWNNLPVTRLKEDQIVCWKFCHVLHKMLRDGHQQVLVNSYDRRQLLLDCGNMWRHVENGYGKLIFKYCTLLYNRISFLARNSCFPNDLKFSDEQLDGIGEGDSGIFFQLSCEIFDSLDDILDLLKTVLSTLELKKLNSMTSAGQCYLSPLVACIQDSSMLYDYIVKILFKLHSSLPTSTLEGHRDRFIAQHKMLKSCYINASNLQFFRTLIQIPHLSDRPPNFLVASDLHQHVTPKVVMIQTKECDSPDPISVRKPVDNSQVLVNLSEDSNYRDLEYTLPKSLIDNSLSLDQSLDSFIDNPDSNVCEAGHSSQSKIEQNSSESLTARIRELDQTVQQLTKELEEEQLNHAKTSRALNEKIAALEELSAAQVKDLEQQVKRLKEDFARSNHMLQVAKNDLGRVTAEYERVKHDSEISSEAMKKLVKDLSDLKSEQANSKSRPLSLVTDDSSERLIKEMQTKIESLNVQLNEKNIRQHELGRANESLLETKMKLERQLESRQEDTLMAEMDETDKILKEASRKIEELSEKSRKSESGIKLQVNEKIAEVCANLMKTVRNLIIQSRLLQREIVGDNKLTNNTEFYKRNSSWTEGLISAANVVAMAARSLVDSADMAMSGQAKYSELAAAAHEVAAATTQLVVASRVKANKDSDKLKILTGVAKQVNQCTNNVVDTARVCAELIEQEVDKVDIGSLSLHQTKKLEMESQVRLLELEDLLSKERIKLGLLRRQHYEKDDKN